MLNSPQLQHFIEDELARAPLHMEEVLQGVLDDLPRLSPLASPADKQVALELRQALQLHRPLLVREFAQALREQVSQLARHQAAAARGMAGGAERAPALSLVDDEAVAADVEISRAINAVRSGAEYELRELGAYTSALVGDMDVAHDTNPFKPEAFVRALWQAAQAMPKPRSFAIALLRDAAPVLTRVLRRAYAAACTRLETQGVEPGAYRTIIIPAGSRSGRSPPPLHPEALRDSDMVPLDALAAPGRGPAAAPLASPLAAPFATKPAPARLDPQLIDLLGRLFDALLAEHRLPPDVKLLLSRLQAPALRMAMQDPSVLDSYTHPLWLLMDRLAFEAQRLAGDAAQRERLLQLAQQVIDHIVREPVQDGAHYRWGEQRLQALTRHLLAQHQQDAASEIAALEARAAAGPAAPPAAGAPATIDVGSLETVPAALMDAAAGEAEGDDWRPQAPLPPAQPGHWLRLFLQGDWREAQLLWVDAANELWLLHDPKLGGRWALRRTALERLHAEGLANALRPASLVQQAAQHVLQRGSSGPALRP